MNGNRKPVAGPRARYLPWAGGVAVCLLGVGVYVLFVRARALGRAVEARTQAFGQVADLGRRLRGAKREEARQPWLNWRERESELGSLLERAANDSGIRQPRLASIEPQQSTLLDRRLGERVILVRLQDVTLQELATFLFAVSSRKGAPHIKELDLSAGRTRPDGWTATVKLSLLFSIGKARPGSV